MFLKFLLYGKSDDVDEYDKKITHNFTKIICGGYHRIAFDIDDNIWAWGDNSLGQLMQDNNIIITKPILFKNEHKFVKFACGDCHTLGLTADGKLWQWGFILGQMIRPEQVLKDTKITKISCGDYNSIAFASGDRIFVWGKNESGELGLGNYRNQPFPQQFTFNEKFKKIMIDCTTSYGFANNETIYAWGYNNYDRLGIHADGNYINLPSLITSSIIIKFKKIIYNISYTFGLGSDGSLYLFEDSETIRKININKYKKVLISQYNNFVIDKNDELFYWTDAEKFLPYEYGRGRFVSNKAKNILANKRSAFIISKTNDVYAFGSNYHGELGLGDKTYRDVAVRTSFTLCKRKKKDYRDKLLRLLGVQKKIDLNFVYDDRS